MFDTVNFNLNSDNCKNVDFLAEIPNYLTDTSEHYFSSGVYINGFIEGLKVSVTSNNIAIKNQSLSKWFLGDNIQTLQKNTTKRAVSKISDLLHLDYCKADVKRVDIGVNLSMKYKPSVYNSNLGTLHYFNRNEFENTLYYNNPNKQIIIYDKIKEQKNNVPIEFKKINILRYELRFEKRILNEFNRPEIKASDLYNEKFYECSIDKLLYYFDRIDKIKDIKISKEVMNNVKKFKEFGFLQWLYTTFKDKNGILDYIDNLDKKGYFENKMQKKRLKDEVLKISDMPDITTDNQNILELEKKLKEAVKNYR